MNKLLAGAPVNFQNSEVSEVRLPSSPGPGNLKFEREDWALFRTVDGLQQKAGVPKSDLARLVLKELTDNGLDEGANVAIGKLGKGYFVEDDGRGIDGTPEEIATLFSIARPMVSTKLLRLPKRGALGNGLRVVAGAVLASEGSLVVITHNRRIALRPQRDGATTVVSVEATTFPVGTRIEIGLGPVLRIGQSEILSWATRACHLSQFGSPYRGKSSPWWYDVPTFHELLYASGKRPVRDLIAHLDGCSGAKAGEIVTEARLGRTLCCDVTRTQAEKLLTIARASARHVQPERLGAVGPQAFPDRAYAITFGTNQVGSSAPFAEIPFVVEAWVQTVQKTSLAVCVNRSPITGSIYGARDSREIDAFGCGLAHTIADAPKHEQFDILVNVTTPYMPITSDGKAPNLEPFFEQISTAVQKAVRKAHRPTAGSGKSQKDIVLDNLDAAIAAVSGDGEFRFSDRQIFYVIRPIVCDTTGKELTYANLKTILTDYQREHGDIPGMYQEPRGSIYHPHRGETITLGTLMVENYERPAWTFNKLVYIEKEGFSEALKDVRWPERHDCMLMSSKGFSTRAARDLVDKLAEHDEPVTIFCVHDADAYGTTIYQTFQNATRARGARKIKIINLGLEPWEGVAMGLEVETVEAGERRKPVADYVRERERERENGSYWENWLQTRRIELNAMTTPAFIAWLDRKMASYQKLVPPADVLEDDLSERIEAKVRDNVRERILREAGFEEQVQAAVARISKPTAADLKQGIEQLFRTRSDAEWRDHNESVAEQITRDDET